MAHTERCRGCMYENACSYIDCRIENDISLYNQNKSVIDLLQESAEEIENLYGKETDLTQRLRSMINKLD